jgi:hypothetical protein
MMSIHLAQPSRSGDSGKWFPPFYKKRSFLTFSYPFPARGNADSNIREIRITGMIQKGNKQDCRRFMIFKVLS